MPYIHQQTPNTLNICYVYFVINQEIAEFTVKLKHY